MKPHPCHQFHGSIPVYAFKRILPLLLIQLLILKHGSSQCTTVSEYEGTTFVTDNSAGLVNFVNPANAKIADNNRAVASVLLSVLGTSSTFYLKATNFGFSIPTVAEICGVTIEVRKRGTGINIFNTIRDNTVRLIAGGVITGNNKATTANWTFPDSYSTYGSSSDKWGVALTPAIVNSNDFGVAISAAYSGLVGVLLTAEIDQIRVTIDYTIPLPVTLGYFTHSYKGKNVYLEWLTAEEEDDSKIILQRSEDNSPWNDLNTWTLSQYNINKTYKHHDVLNSEGNYSYRLKIILSSGKEKFSEVRQVKYSGTSLFRIYPNPAKNFVFVNAGNPVEVQVYNLNNQLMKVPIEKYNGGLKLNLFNFSPGIYIIKSDDQSIKFYKE